MRLSRRILFAVAALLVALFLTPSAQAVLYNRVFISPNGNDSNVCANPLFPCATFAGALAQVQPGGEVIAQATGGYGQLTITQSVTINGPSGVVMFSGYPAYINAAGAKVVIRGLTIDVAAGYGIDAAAFSALHIENCVISGTSADGIYVTSPGHLFLRNTVVRSAGGYGVRLTPSTGSLNAVIEHCQAENNAGIGFDMEGNGHFTIRDTVSASNGNDGYYIYAPPATNIDVTLESCTASNNSGDGVLAQNAGATVRVSNSTVTDNVAYGFDNILGATFQSRQNNTVEGNVGGQTSGSISSFASR